MFFFKFYFRARIFFFVVVINVQPIFGDGWMNFYVFEDCRVMPWGRAFWGQFSNNNGFHAFIFLLPLDSRDQDERFWYKKTLKSGQWFKSSHFHSNDNACKIIWARITNFWTTHPILMVYLSDKRKIPIFWLLSDFIPIFQYFDLKN